MAPVIPHQGSAPEDRPQTGRLRDRPPPGSVLDGRPMWVDDDVLGFKGAGLCGSAVS